MAPGSNLKSSNKAVEEDNVTNMVEDESEDMIVSENIQIRNINHNDDWKVDSALKKVDEWFGERVDVSEVKNQCASLDRHNADKL